MKNNGDNGQGDLFGKQFGTKSKFLYRREGPDTSREAAEQIDSTRLERMVRDTILSFGKRGCISDEVRERNPGHPYSSITARYKALMDKGFIIDTGERRIGKSGRNMRVMVAIEYCNNSQNL
jgi:hypothetical protein